jgi:uncharacterized BrkB/YihY/UPF0761 family membrane protein
MADTPSIEPPPFAPEQSDGESPVPGFVTRWKSKATDKYDDLQGRRSSSKLIDTVFGSVEHEANVGGGLLAGALAFRLFLFLIPYAFVLVYVVGFSATSSGMDTQELARKLGIVGLAASAIHASSSASLLTRIVTLLVAIYALLLGSLNLVRALRMVHALIWRVPITKLKRPAVKVFGAIGIFTMSLVLVHLTMRLRSHSSILGLIGIILFVAVPIGVWLFCAMTVFPHAEQVTWRDLFPGAALFGTGILAMHLFTIYWVARSIEQKSETYGALGAALTFLLWAYLVGRLVTASASLNATLFAAGDADSSDEP